MTAGVVRVSRGTFNAHTFESIRVRLDESQATLVPAITALPGCLHYWAGIDRLSNTMTNVSIWTSVEHARQMDTLEPMVALAAEFVGLGVRFERPIINYEIVWTLHDTTTSL
jgi:hypothetical protein